ncbi:hypothetical protein [Beduinella massiliensis]|uniref:hypothetical protein n=1 Tax=Beduinella massiliensis TaxID=1852363 RepID=UPI000C8246A8
MNEKETKVRGRIGGKNLLSMAGRVAGSIVLVAVLGLLLQVLSMIGNFYLRMLISCAVIVGCFLMQFSSGGGQGERDVTFGAMLGKRTLEGYQPTKEEKTKCFTPLKGLAAAALGAAPFVLCALVVAAAAEPYTYTLQDLPSWASAYAYRADIYAPLSYYGQSAGAGLADYLRILVRACNMLYLLPLGDAVTYYGYLIDRLGPALLLVFPLGYVLGYLRGPALHKKRIAYNEQAKKAQLKKIKRNKKREQAARRAKERKGPEQLI